MSWSDLTTWWLAELETDPAYETVITPLVIEVMQPVSGAVYLDAGAGEGRLMRRVSSTGSSVVGIDANEGLAKSVPGSVVALLPDIPIRSSFFDGVYSVLTLEHISDHKSFFSETWRVTKPGGQLAVVMNHPAWTAPGSTPISDEDGEVLWRPGDYFSDGYSDEPAGETSVRFHHRSMSALLNNAAAAGWSLEWMIEQPHHELAAQSGIPRLLACRWRR